MAKIVLWDTKVTMAKYIIAQFCTLGAMANRGSSKCPENCVYL